MTKADMEILKNRLRLGLDSLKLDENPTTDFLFKTTEARCAMAFCIGFLLSKLEDGE